MWQHFIVDYGSCNRLTLLAINYNFVAVFDRLYYNDWYSSLYDKAALQYQPYYQVAQVYKSNIKV